MNIKKSNELKERSRKIYPALTGTFSRSASSFVEGVYPVYAEYGNGSKFVDVDGNEYLDFLCGNVEDKQIGPKSIIDLIFFEKQSLQ